MSVTRAGRPARLLLAVAAAALLPVGSRPVRAHDPVDINVSFNREVVRILQRKCSACHAAGALSIPLTDYRDVRAWGRAIREELVEHRMPPAIVAPGYGRYESDPGLSTRELETLLVWLDGGMPRGDDADRPAPPPAPDQLPDTSQSVTIPLPPQTIPAGEDVVIRRVTVDAGPAAGRSAARVELRPGNRRVVRGARVFVGEQWLGAWLPWQHTIAPPASHAFALPARARFTVDLHYRGAGATEVDQSAIEVSFAGDTAVRRVDDFVIEATIRKGAHARGRAQLRGETTIWALYPAFDASVKSLELRAERPDGAAEVLLWIPQARPEWPLALVMRQPLSLPAGSLISLIAETDGSTRAATPRVTLSVLQEMPRSR